MAQLPVKKPKKVNDVSVPLEDKPTENPNEKNPYPNPQQQKPTPVKPVDQRLHQSLKNAWESRRHTGASVNIRCKTTKK
jgi:hypothetical protein